MNGHGPDDSKQLAAGFLQRADEPALYVPLLPA